MSDSTLTLKYTSLDRTLRSIRLLTIRPDLSADGLIQCNLLKTTIDASDNDYTCLSYVWGPPTENLCGIRVDGYLTYVRPNLHDFLTVARTRFTKKSLWIDALCIDQSNLSERNHQVQQMGTIYSHAKEVLAWLGSNLFPPQFDFQMFNKELQHACSTSISKQGWSKLSVKIIALIIRNEYWGRAWIAQEIIRAKKVRLVAGPFTLEFNHIITAARTDWEIEAANLILLGFQHDKYNDRTSDSSLPKLGHLLVGISGHLRHCYDPRDRIYSLLSLCEEGANITVDYSITLLELAIEILKIDEGKLCFCHIFEVVQCLGDAQILRGDPAWCENLRVQIRPTSQPKKLESRMSVEEVHELNLSLVSSDVHGVLIWYNGAVRLCCTKWEPDSQDWEPWEGKISFVKDEISGHVWRFSFAAIVHLYEVAYNPASKDCLRKRTPTTIGFWE